MASIDRFLPKPEVHDRPLSENQLEWVIKTKPTLPCSLIESRFNRDYEMAPQGRVRGGKSSVSFDRTGSSLLELISAIGLLHGKKERTFTAGVAPHVVPKAGFDFTPFPQPQQ